MELPPIGECPEYHRIRALEIKSPPSDHDHDTIAMMVYRPEGTMTLFASQLQALVEARRSAGLVAPIPVGGGKTLIAALLPTVMPCSRPLIVAPASLLRQAQAMITEYRRHFFVREDLRFLSYEMMSRPGKQSYLHDYRPDLVIADECHRLSIRTSARTKRFRSYFSDYPDARFCALSGTLAKSSIRDFSDLAHIALRSRSPVPRRVGTVNEWAHALDASPRMCGEEVTRDPGVLMTITGCADDGSGEPADRRALARVRFADRCYSSDGFVRPITDTMSIGLSVNMIESPNSEVLDRSLRDLESRWISPAGEEISFALDYDRCRRQIASGGYTYWDWPSDPDREWMDARNAYARDVRQYLRSHPRSKIDSPALIESAIKYGRMRDFASGPAWRRIKDRPAPPTKWRWLDSARADWAADWARGCVGIVWVSTPEVGRYIADRARIAYYGAGAAAARKIALDTAERSIVCSIQSHGTGRNLQKFHRNLIFSALSSGREYEQLIGRTHRTGQTRPVEIEVPDCFHGDLEAAVEKARFLGDILACDQKLLVACKGGQGYQSEGGQMAAPSSSWTVTSRPGAATES
jgi:hypothetical protein